MDNTEKKTWCPNCQEKGTVSEDCFQAVCPDCGEGFDPRNYTPENWSDDRDSTDS